MHMGTAGVAMGVMDELGQQGGDQYIAQHNHHQRTVGDLVHETGGHHKHGHDHDAVGVAEVAQRGLGIQAASEDKRHHAEQGRECHGDFVQHIADHGQRADDEADY